MNVDGLGLLCFIAGVLAFAIGQAACKALIEYYEEKEHKIWMDTQYRIQNQVSLHECRYHSETSTPCKGGKCASRPKK